MELRVRAEILRTHGARKGWSNDAELARHLGVAPATVSRYLSGKIQPGVKFVTGILVAFPEVDPRLFLRTIDTPELPAPTGPHNNSRRRN